MGQATSPPSTGRSDPGVSLFPSIEWNHCGDSSQKVLQSLCSITNSDFQQVCFLYLSFLVCKIQLVMLVGDPFIYLANTCATMYQRRHHNELEQAGTFPSAQEAWDGYVGYSGARKILKELSICFTCRKTGVDSALCMALPAPSWE